MSKAYDPYENVIDVMTEAMEVGHIDKKMFEIIVEKEGLEFLGWREVPTDPTTLGQKAIDCMPYIMQGFVKRPKDCPKGIDFDRKLYVARRVFEQSNDNTYVVSFSSRTIVYKGMFLVEQLRLFFKDLQDKDYESAIATVHSRFSTNTNPSWERAHPNRFIVHNGEINTIRGNADKMLAREETMESEHLKGELQKVLPVVNTAGSDSAMLDNTLEFLVMSGMDLPLAVMITIPEPWANNSIMSQKKKDFYQYYATMMEPWDGPASILFSDGDIMGAVLDRNGLRPSRYYITTDDYLILSSEVGVLEIEPERIKIKERLRPGKMLLVDTVKGEVIDDNELKDSYANMQPYGEWLDRNLVELKDLKIPNERVIEHRGEDLSRLQKAFGYTYESTKDTILPMARNGAESIAAMGIDSPIPVLSKDQQPLFNYFKQLFAQVTNPPIDCIREEIVTSTSVYVGRDGNLLEEEPKNCQVLKINNPILTNTDMLKIKNMKVEGFKAVTVPITYYKSAPLDRAMDRLFVEVDRAHRAGANILILSDRGVDENHVAIPSLLAVSAVHQHLVKTKKRTSLAIILESGEPREVHHFATLLGYGACAINPYLALDTIHELIEEGMIKKDYYAAVEDYNHAVISGIVKIAAKMGISTIQSYQGSQIFEAIGISADVIDKYFTGTVSRVGGITLEDIAKDVDERHSQAFDPLELSTDLTLDSIGRHKSRSQGEEHRYNPRTIHTLQESTRRGDYKMFKEYTAMVDSEESGYLRSLMDFDYPEQGVPLEEVESVDSIVKRFKTGAMSYGSISQEAHETLAIAMNRLHGKSNTGEGGESDDRLESPERCSAIKQVASGRFGVTSKYLVSAKEIQIKMAQGAKPGEGGHLPAGKVYPWIAKTRHSTPGVSLISPPPHHDIYSIEDLAELIFDLKNANPGARVSVKLVSEAGVGTIATGVAKGAADKILISGHNGGSGAAARDSIWHAGLPLELGLAEAQQTLLQNGLRSRVVLEADGKLMDGTDVAVACLLGAEEFGFATMPLISMGCLMQRDCQQDTCPAGIATQNCRLRRGFRGKPEHVEHFMLFVAEQLREVMASLGFRTVDEMVGHPECLRQIEVPGNRKANLLDLSPVLASATCEFGAHIPGADGRHFLPQMAADSELDKTLDSTLFVPYTADARAHLRPIRFRADIANVNRCVGTILGNAVTKAHPEGLPAGSITIDCDGSAGQSFGAFLPRGITLNVCGDANDYFGKSLSGGEVSVRPNPHATYKFDENIIVGNVAFFGATSGRGFINGLAGQRFGVRNSGATVVVEGCGNHGCEYMTGGLALILGEVGQNFAAGMTGGVAYVFDQYGTLDARVNHESVELKAPTAGELAQIRALIQEHVDATQSPRGIKLLYSFETMSKHFVKVIPTEYERVLAIVAAAEAVGKTHAQAEELAFDIVTGRASAADVARFDVAGAASVAASSVASTKKEA